MTLKVIVPPPPFIVPVPVNGMHGCWLVSPVPRPVIDPAPSDVALPLPFAAMVAVLPSTLVVALPAYFAAKTTFADAAARAAAAVTAVSATITNATIEIRNFVKVVLLSTN